jgi:predicted ATPase/class 3 adenylate cyclase
MAELPRGTVTLLFTDIEGSTRLLHELGDAYAEVLAEHRRVLREAFGRYGGVEVDTQGDAFFYAFARASDAVAAAGDAQAALAAGPVRVRIGVHTGEPLVTDEGYVGVDVHRAARIMSAGHGGQVLVSERTRAQLDGEPELTNLGLHRLKDLGRAEKLFQLGNGAFPPLKTLDATNLPVAANVLLGRERELGELLQLFDDGTRLLTITGPGGTGKTRLALQVAAELVGSVPDGVFWVPLAGLRDPKLVLPTIGQTLGAHGDVIEHLRGKELVLLLDNLEHLLDAAPDVAGLLSGSSRLRVLVTSRAPLRLAAEHEYPLAPLRSDAAVTLFVERARSTGRALEPDGTVEAICARLDCLPLAVELAAARTKLLAPELLLERLDRALPVLTGGARDAPERQRTLRATIGWSYDLLDERVKRLFALLSVFNGRFSIAAAEEVCGADLDGLRVLVESSLVRPVGDSDLLLLETIREYASERLAGREDLEQMRRSHAEYYAALATRLAAGRPADARYVELEKWHDNIRAALSHFERTGAHERELRLVCALERFWLVRGYLEEADDRVGAALARSTNVPPPLRASAHAAAADFARALGHASRAVGHAEASLELARRERDANLITRALHELGEALQAAGEYERAESAFEEAISVATAAGRTADGALTNLGDLALIRGDYPRAIELSNDALRRFRAKGASAEALIPELNLGIALFHLGRTDEAKPHFRTCLEGFTRLGYTEARAWCLYAAAAVAVRAGRADGAARLVAAADSLLDEVRATLGASERGLRSIAVDASSAGAEEEVPLDDVQSLALAELT